MITDPYRDIRPEIRDLMEEFIPKDDTYLVGHTRRLARTIQVLLDQNPQGRLLELGTNGLIPFVLNNLSPELEITVTDFDEQRPLRATSVLYSRTAGSGVQVECLSLDLEKTALPVNDEYFDYILCTEVIEHMEIDPMFMLSELNRTMKNGGTLVLTTPNIVSTHGLTKMMMGIEPYFYMQYQKSRSYHRHNYEYSIHSLSKVLRAAGFNGSIWTEDTFEDSMPTVVSRLSAAGFDIRNVGDNIMTVAKKVSPVVDRYPGVIYVD